MSSIYKTKRKNKKERETEEKEFKLILKGAGGVNPPDDSPRMDLKGFIEKGKYYEVEVLISYYNIGMGGFLGYRRKKKVLPGKEVLSFLRLSIKRITGMKFENLVLFENKQEGNLHLYNKNKDCFFRINYNIFIKEEENA